MAVHAGLAQVLGRNHCRATKINGYKLLSQGLLNTFTVAATESKEHEAGLIPTVLPKTPYQQFQQQSLGMPRAWCFEKVCARLAKKDKQLAWH